MLVRSRFEVYCDIRGKFKHSSSTIRYTAVMARGWESKSVEDQISAREAEAQRSAKVTFTPQQREIQSKRDGLLLLRIRTLSTLQSAQDARYRKQQEHALAHLDAELAALDSANPQK